MLRSMVILLGVLAVLAAATEVQARGFRRSRGNCPNGQCYAQVPAAAPADTVVATSGAESADLAAPTDPDAFVSVAAPAEVAETNPVTENETSTHVVRTGSRLRFRFFRRR